MMELMIDTKSMDSYRQFIAVKGLPKYAFRGRTAIVPDEYAAMLKLKRKTRKRRSAYKPIEGLFDYQRDIAKTAIEKRKYSVFADCGLGKTLILLDFARHASSVLSKRQSVLIISPLMVIKQTLEEANRFYGDSLQIEQIRASSLSEWITSGKSRIGITNYEALKDDTPSGRIGGLILDESSMLKSHYGKWGTKCIDLGKGCEWKLACTGTPAPNDRIEYANHAVFMDAALTVNAFLARYFVNRGQTDNRWEIKPHALHPFYNSLSHWAIFLSNPETYGWTDNTGTIPPIHVHIHDIPLTDEQRSLVHNRTGRLFISEAGGIMGRSMLGQLAKGHHNGQAVRTNKPEYIRNLVNSWPNESTLIWCIYNNEQDIMERTFPGAGSIRGDTPHDKRQQIIDDFKSGRNRVLISKPKVLGFGLNLHIATRQVFSGLQDSYESYYQAVKRSNRIGSTKPLNVHIPITEIERPMIETVLRKAKEVQKDTDEQERIFSNARNTAR